MCLFVLLDIRFVFGKSVWNAGYFSFFLFWFRYRYMKRIPFFPCFSFPLRLSLHQNVHSGSQTLYNYLDGSVQCLASFRIQVLLIMNSVIIPLSMG